MTVTLPPELEKLVRQKVETGQYDSADQVVQEALRLLEERDRRRRLREAIAVGDAQLARGEGVVLTDERLEQIKRNAEEMARQGVKPSPDVCP